VREFEKCGEVLGVPWCRPNGDCCYWYPVRVDGSSMFAPVVESSQPLFLWLLGWLVGRWLLVG